MKRQVTLKQIAKELDVSISTVSKALRDSDEISEDTRDKVKAFAKLYNYRPNNIALSLKNRKTKTIGVIIPEIVHHFFTKVILGIETVAVKNGYNVLVGLSNESFDKEVLNMELLANGSIDGFIISTSKGTLLQQDYHHYNESINQGMPIVMFDRVIPEIACDKIIIDDVAGARNAVQKFIDNGCRNIALITTKDYVNVGRMRTQGYLQALKKNHIIPKSELILKVDDDHVSESHLEVLEANVLQLFKNNRNIDSVLGVNEVYATTALKVARKLKLKVPEDVQIIGFTDGVLSRHARPSLTTVSQHAQKMGEKAAELLIHRLENGSEEDAFQTIVLPTEIIERESTI